MMVIYESEPTEWGKETPKIKIIISGVGSPERERVKESSPAVRGSVADDDGVVWFCV